MDEALIEDTLDRLNRYGQAATYGAVAGVVGTFHRSVMQGRIQNHRHSWVVNKLHRVPTGYDGPEIDPRLSQSIAKNSVIETPEDLEDWLTAHP